MLVLNGKEIMNVEYKNQRDDALTEVLDTLQIEGHIYCVNDMKKPWAIEEKDRKQIYFYVIERGSGHIKFERRKKEVVFEGGDLLLITSGEHHIVYNGSPDNPVSNRQFFSEDVKARHYLQIHGGSDEETKFICGAFFFKYLKENALVSSLPSVVHIKAENGETENWLKPLLQLLSDEARNSNAGAGAVINRLTEIIFVQAIRVWIKTQKDEQTGWLAALKDTQICRVLNLLHQNPAKDWTVAEIAAEAGMSRSPFAAKFTKLVGEPPLKYLTKWRMNLAADYLQSSELNTGEIAQKVGYETVAAFSKNFKKQFGKSPREFKKN